jgi:hypothetical protein
MRAELFGHPSPTRSAMRYWSAESLGSVICGLIPFAFIQDDDIDWKEESGKMAEIYYNSYLTICVTSAQSDDGGLRPRALKSVPQKVVVKRQFRDYEVYFRLLDELRAVHLDWHYDIFIWLRTQALNPLISRGWTCQERLMSPRLLHFGHAGLLWQCPELQALSVVSMLRGIPQRII